MCGRFFRHRVSWEEYHAYLGLFRPEVIPELPEAYNVAPTQRAPIIRMRDGDDQPEVAVATWGLIPRWWKKPLSEKTFATFNAKGEDAASKASFRGSFRDRPCLVPMSGYYEWQGKRPNRQPHAVGLRNRRWFYCAGLWDRAMIGGEQIDSFTILTVGASASVASIHHRMPVIPPPDRVTGWIRGTPADRTAMIEPYAGPDLHAWPVDPAVGNVRNQGEHLVKEITRP